MCSSDLTAEGALALRLEGETGRVAVGLAADLLIVEGAPDREIHDLRRPLLVLRDGIVVHPVRPAPPTLRLPPAVSV